VTHNQRICLIAALFVLQGCSSCDDDTFVEVDAGVSDTAVPDVGGEGDGGQATDGGLAGDFEAGDVGAGDSGDMNPDMGKPPGPRAALQYRGHRLVQDPRIARLDIAPTADGFFVATGTAGDPVVWSLGEPDEQTVEAVFPQSFQSIWAHYDNDLNLRATRTISSYPGGPRAGGTSAATSIELEPSGSRLIAGEMMASVEFGGTVWSTTSTSNGDATEGYVARTTDTSETALFRLRTQNGAHSVYVRGMLLHGDGDITTGGWFNGTMYLPDNTALTDTDGQGFLVHTAADGTLRWTLQTPATSAQVDSVGDKLLVRMRLPMDQGFEFDGVTYPAPTLDWATGIALVDSDGSVDWFHRMEAGPNVPIILASAPLPGGGVVIAYRAQNEVFPELGAVPDLSGNSNLLAFDANGDVLWSTKVADELAEYRGLAVDSHGIAWTTLSTCADEELEFEPKWSPDVAVSPCGPADSDGNRPLAMLLLGYDTATGELGYAHTFASGSVSIALVDMLADDSVLVVGNYFEPVTVMPGTPDEAVADGLPPGPNDFVQLYLIME
jgi:hypothetical protein